MPIELDGFAVLGRIAAASSTFGDVRKEAAKSARTLVVKQLKARGAGLRQVRAVTQALGEESAGLVLDGLSEAETKSIVTRLDRHHPELRGSTGAWRRSHLRRLVSGDAEPAERQTAAKARKQRSAAAPSRASDGAPRLGSEAMDVFRQSLKKSK